MQVLYFMLVFYSISLQFSLNIIKVLFTLHNIIDEYFHCLSNGVDFDNLYRINNYIRSLRPEESDYFNTSRPRQDGRHFPDDIFKFIFLNENL